MALPSIGPKVGMTLATSIAFEQKDGNKLQSCWTRVCITFFTTFVTPFTLAARSHWSARTKIYSLNTFNFTSLELVHSTMCFFSNGSVQSRLSNSWSDSFLA